MTDEHWILALTELAKDMYHKQWYQRLTLTLHGVSVVVDAIYSGYPQYLTTEEYNLRYNDPNPTVDMLNLFWRDVPASDAKDLVMQLDPTFDAAVWQLQKELRNV